MRADICPTCGGCGDDECCSPCRCHDEGDLFCNCDACLDQSSWEDIRLVAEGRCLSCEHGTDIHDVDGVCWFTVAQGTPGKNLVCPCHVRESQVL
jgi:hypothetical protein